MNGAEFEKAYRHQLLQICAGVSGIEPSELEVQVKAEILRPRSAAEIEWVSRTRRFHQACDYLRRRRWGRIQGRWIAQMLRNGLLVKDAAGKFEIVRRAA